MALPPGVDVFFAVSWGQTEWVITWQGVVPLAILFSGLLGAGVAIGAIRSARQIARQKNAADFVFQSNNDERLRRAFAFIRKIHFDPDVSVEFYAYKANAEKCPEQAENIRYILNHYESVAVNIKRRIYDEDVIKETDYTLIINLWKGTKPFIEKFRVEYGQETAYQEYETLVDRWKANPLKSR